MKRDVWEKTSAAQFIKGISFHPSAARRVEKALPLRYTDNYTKTEETKSHGCSYFQASPGASSPNKGLAQC